MFAEQTYLGLEKTGVFKNENKNAHNLLQILLDYVI